MASTLSRMEVRRVHHHLNHFSLRKWLKLFPSKLIFFVLHLFTIALMSCDPVTPNPYQVLLPHRTRRHTYLTVADLIFFHINTFLENVWKGKQKLKKNLYNLLIKLVLLWHSKNQEKTSPQNLKTSHRSQFSFISIKLSITVSLQYHILDNNSLQLLKLLPHDHNRSILYHVFLFYMMSCSILYAQNVTLKWYFPPCGIFMYSLSLQPSFES